MAAERISTKTIASISHVIFDMDGLLLDTERIYTTVYERVAAHYGKKYTWEIKEKLMGRPTLIGAQMAIELMQLPITPEVFIKESQNIKDELFPSAILLPGAEKLVRHLVKHNIPIALASGSATKDFHSKTTNHKDFFSLFPIIVLGDNPDLKHGKPAPDQFLLTKSKFKDTDVDSINILVFEDSPNGVLAAKAAGMNVVLVPDERLDKNLYHDPSVALISLDHFQPELFDLPKYDS